MKITRQSNISANSLVHILFVFFLVLNCNSVYNSGAVDYHLEVVCCVLGLLLLLTDKKIERKVLPFIILYIAYQVPLLLVTLGNGNYIVTYLMKYMLYIPLIVLLESQSLNFLEKSIEYFISIIYCLALISLFFYVFAVILGWIGPTGTYFLRWGRGIQINSYFGVFFESSLDKIFASKNSAIFAESPVWAAILAIATTFELFYRKEKVHMKYIVVFYVAMITTFSTTAYIFLILSFVAIAYVYYDVIFKSRYEKLLFFTFFFVLVFGGLMACLLILQDKSSRGFSFTIRAGDLLSAFRVIKDHPVLGLGFGYDGSWLLQYHSTEYIAISRSFGGFGQSSDFAYLLATGGLYFALFYMGGLYGIANQCDGRKKYMTLGLLIYVFVISRVGATLLFFQWVTCGVYKLIIVPHRGRLRISQQVKGHPRGTSAAD